MIYIISDTHFGHSNIIKLGERPFTDKQDMEDKLIDNWNKTISNKDLIYHLGDFALGNSEYIESILQKLNGRKILIKGNHDAKSCKWYMERGFEIALDSGILLEDKYLLTHKPTNIENSKFINIHGHLHQKTIGSEYYFNASVELIGYKPILFDSIKEIIS